MREAMELWEERERARAELLATLDNAKHSLAQGRGRVITEASMQELADEVHRLADLIGDRDTGSPREQLGHLESSIFEVDTAPVHLRCETPVELEF
jgi:hypothetical protein